MRAAAARKIQLSVVPRVAFRPFGNNTLRLVTQPTARVRALQRIVDEDKLILIPMLLSSELGPNVTRAKALLDTGSTTTCVSQTLLKHLGLEHAITPIPLDESQHITPFTDSVRVLRLGTIELRLSCNGRSRSAIFEVIESDAVDAIIGMDLFAPLGFSIGGLPTTFDDDANAAIAASTAAATAEDLLRVRPKPWSLADRISDEHHVLLMGKIAAAIAANEALDSSSEACSAFPDATMTVPLSVSSSYRHQYPWPRAADTTVRETLAKWLATNVVEPVPDGVVSNWNSALLAVGKKDHNGLKTDWRICMDTRHLNETMTPESTANDHASARMPHLHEIFRRMAGFKYASTIDLTNAYGQLPIAVTDRDKLTFTVDGKRYRWRRWPFGLKPATSRFQKIMEAVLSGLDFVTVFVDDICVFSDGSIEDHADKVAQVLARLNEHNLRINRSKSHFGFTKILMLGHFLSGESRQIDPLKVEQSITWPSPTSPKEMQRFLGFVNYIRDYIPNHSQIVEPLHKLANLKTKSRFTLSGRQAAAFSALLTIINGAPVLENPDPDLPLCVATDASQTGLGAILYQVGKEGRRRYIAFASSSLDGAQRNYPATKRELLGIVFALHKFHNFVFGRPFNLFTDHKALVALNTTRTLSYVLANWLDTILQYDFTVHHRPGNRMILPDALSRMFTELDENVSNNDANDSLRISSVSLANGATSRTVSTQADQPRITELLATSFEPEESSIRVATSTKRKSVPKQLDPLALRRTRHVLKKSTFVSPAEITARTAANAIHPILSGPSDPAIPKFGRTAGGSASCTSAANHRRAHRVPRVRTCRVHLRTIPQKPR